MLIFAYGSNMNINRLQERVPSASKLSTAFLKGYQLICNKISSKDGSAKANIIETGTDDDIVWGVLFVIDDLQKTDLDKLEGLGKGYDEKVLTFVDTTGHSHNAHVYIATDDKYLNNQLLPYDWYREFILTGAIKEQLPLDYINQLETIKSTVDPNVTRRQLNFDIINRNQ
ncbi:gamma-glutamylcyclotransferase family protein [Flavobacterium terrisoli]|uniref:gamma-glutamylcyclotransferase family protein n=1 Tax=Flavobacterium terrisoli TaxID=3242195 RepID=UPI00254316D8|nr:gamma-glutamylcyclotransferase family protein [Flavobacterium buctense]